MKITMTLFAAALALALPAMGQSPGTTTPNAGTSSTTAQTGPAVSATATNQGIDAGSQQLFEMLDANKDGNLSRDEFLRLPQLSGGKPAPGTNAGATGTGVSTSPAPQPAGTSAPAPANPQR